MWSPFLKRTTTQSPSPETKWFPRISSWWPSQFPLSCRWLLKSPPITANQSTLNPLFSFLWVVGLRECGPMLLLWAMPGLVPWAETQPPGTCLQVPTLCLALRWSPTNANPGNITVRFFLVSIRGFGTALRHLFWMPPCSLPGKVFQVCTTGGRLWERPRTRWRDYDSQLVWECLGILQEVSTDRVIRASLLVLSHLDLDPDNVVINW